MHCSKNPVPAGIVYACWEVDVVGRHRRRISVGEKSISLMSAVIPVVGEWVDERALNSIPVSYRPINILGWKDPLGFTKTIVSENSWIKIIMLQNVCKKMPAQISTLLQGVFLKSNSGSWLLIKTTNIWFCYCSWIQHLDTISRIEACQPVLVFSYLYVYQYYSLWRVSLNLVIDLEVKTKHSISVWSTA